MKRSLRKQRRNIFLRFLLNDINKQHLEAKQLFLEASEGKVKLFTSTFDLEDCYHLAYAKASVAKVFKTFDVKLEKEFKKTTK